MKKKFLSAVMAASVAAMMMAGCGSNEKAAETKAAEAVTTEAAEAATTEAAATEEKKVIKLGVRDNTEAIDLCMDSINAAGYEIEVVVFDDSIQPNVALAEGSIDINWYQHEPYMKAYNEANGTDFVMVQPKTAAPLFAMYSTKIESVDELEDGATIGLCNDATNQARGLHLLESQGLITLPEDVETPTYLDIVDNPKNLQFIETDMQLLPQSIDDVDAICLAGAHMANAGTDANDYVVASDDAEEFAVGMVVTAENADAEWATGLAKAVQCDALAEYYATEKQGTMVPTWK